MYLGMKIIHLSFIYEKCWIPYQFKTKTRCNAIFFKDKNIGLLVLYFFNSVNRREILTFQIIFSSVFDR